MNEQKLVCVTDIAMIVSPRVARTAVSNWVAKYSSDRYSPLDSYGLAPFPNPVVETRAGKLFDLYEVIDWIDDAYSLGRVRSRPLPIEKIEDILNMPQQLKVS